METWAPNLKPNVVYEVDFRSRDIGHGVEEGTFVGYFTGEVVAWGKHAWRVVEWVACNVDYPPADKLYLFPDELTALAPPQRGD